MEFTLYQFSKRRNSTKRPTASTPQRKLSGWHKDDSSIYSPTFTIQERLIDYTYLQWEGKFYYINDFIFIRKNYYELVCELDVLATYKENILNTSAFVSFSSSTYSNNIIDTRCSTAIAPTIKTESSQLLTDCTTSLSTGTYILSYVTSQPTYGASGVLWLSQAACKNIAHSLSSEGFIGWLDAFPKQLAGAYDALLSCFFVPFKWAAESGTEGNIWLGNYDTGITGKFITNKMYSCSVKIPWQYSDFRNIYPYTSLILYLPGYGYAELNPSDYIGLNNLNVELYIDGSTGTGTYLVGDLFKATTTFAVPIAIGTIKSNALGAIQSALATAGTAAAAVGASIATGGVGAPAAIATAAGIAGSAANTFITSQQRSLGSIGSNGGISSLIATPIADESHVACFTISHDTIQQPTSFDTIAGRPCNQILSLRSLSGFCQTLGASVTTPTAVISNKINSFLDGGIYLE